MPLLDLCRRWMDDQNEIVSNDGYDDFLLGFEVERLRPERVKTYVRRLWLAFESGHKLKPKRFFDPQAEKFSKEISDWVAILAHDPVRLEAELKVDRALGLDGEPQGSMFLADIAHTILVKNKWGEALWGSKKRSEDEHRAAFVILETGNLPRKRVKAAPARERSRTRKRGEDRHLELLANPKPEEGEAGPPRWPRDQERIMLTTRHWMAALLQAKTRAAPVRERNVPRVTCPEDPDQRRQWLAARFAETQRESSPDPVLEPEEPAAVSEPGSVFVIKQEEPPGPLSPGHQPMHEITETPAPSLHGAQERTTRHQSVWSIRSTDTEPWPLTLQLTRAASAKFTPTAAKASSVRSRKSTKRKRKQRVPPNKRAKVSSDNLPPQPSSTHSLRLVGKNDTDRSPAAIFPLALHLDLSSASPSFRSSARQSSQVDIATTYRTSPPSVPSDRVERPPAALVFGLRAVTPPEPVHREQPTRSARDITHGDTDTGIIHTVPDSEVDFDQFADPTADDTTLSLAEPLADNEPFEAVRPDEIVTSTCLDTHDDADIRPMRMRVDSDGSFHTAVNPSAGDISQSSARLPAGNALFEAPTSEWSAISARLYTHDDADTGLVRRRLNSDASFHQAADLSAGEMTSDLIGSRASPPNVDHSVFQPAPVRTGTQRISAYPAPEVAGPSTDVPRDMELELARRISARMRSHGSRESSVLPAGPSQDRLPLAATPREPSKVAHLMDPPNPSFIVSQLSQPGSTRDVGPSSRRCSKCNHLLDRARDCYKPDQHGLVQFRKTCIYCRGIAQSRPSLADASTQTPPAPYERSVSNTPWTHCVSAVGNNSQNNVPEIVHGSLPQGGYVGFQSSRTKTRQRHSM